MSEDSLKHFVLHEYKNKWMECRRVVLGCSFYIVKTLILTFQGKENFPGCRFHWSIAGRLGVPITLIKYLMPFWTLKAACNALWSKSMYKNMHKKLISSSKENHVHEHASRNKFRWHYIRRNTYYKQYKNFQHLYYSDVIS